MSQLQVIPNGAVLIHNGLVEQVGPTRRIENLAAARDAHDIDATGRIVMPAFTDADTALVDPRHSGKAWGADRASVSKARRTATRSSIVPVPRSTCK